MQNTYQEKIDNLEANNSPVRKKLEGGIRFKIKSNFQPAGDQPEAIKKILKNLKDKFPNSKTKSFDKFLKKSDSVICTYRSTSCLGTALNFGKFCLLLKNKNYTNNKNYQNLNVLLPLQYFEAMRRF